MEGPHAALPNLFQFYGNGYAIAYSTGDIPDKRHLDIQRGRRILTFTGDQVSTLATGIGDLVTVVLHSQSARHSKTFTILVPSVHLAEGRNRQAVATTAIITTSRTGAVAAGAVQSYSTIPLRGAARRVSLPEAMT